MTKKIIKITAMAALVAGSIGMANAAPVTVTVKGSVSAVTCDLGVDTSVINLPTIAPTDFQAGAGTIATASEQNFKVLTNNCAGTITPTSGQGALKITGPFTTSGTQYFSDAASPDFAIGVMKKGTTTLLHNNDTIDIATPGAALTAINNVSTEFTTALINAGASKPTKGGSVTAPITFTFVYN